MFESSMITKGQTTRSKAIRDSRAVKAGDKVHHVIVDEGVLIMPGRSTGRGNRSLHLMDRLRHRQLSAFRRAGRILVFQ